MPSTAPADVAGVERFCLLPPVVCVSTQPWCCHAECQQNVVCVTGEGWREENSLPAGGVRSFKLPPFPSAAPSSLPATLLYRVLSSWHVRGSSILASWHVRATTQVCCCSPCQRGSPRRRSRTLRPPPPRPPPPLRMPPWPRWIEASPPPVPTPSRSSATSRSRVGPRPPPPPPPPTPSLPRPPPRTATGRDD